jgi:hypothetical protein
VLRERTQIVAQNKSFSLSESIETKLLLQLENQKADWRTAHMLWIQFLLFCALFVFGLMDRITGDWTVVNAEWLQSFYENIVKAPGLWFFISLLLWMLVAYGFNKKFNHMNQKAQGVTTVRRRYNRPVVATKLGEFLLTKKYTAEELKLSPHNEIIRTSYIEPAETWGGSSPQITLEFDRKNEYLLSAEIVYNREHADQNVALNAHDLELKLENEFEEARIWRPLDRSHEDLAVDKRAEIERKRLEAEDAENGEEGADDE